MHVFNSEKWQKVAIKISQDSSVTQNVLGLFSYIPAVSSIVYVQKVMKI